MATFVHHGGHIGHLPRGIHENKRSPCFGKRTIISSRRFADAAFQIEAVHFIHCLQTACKKRTQLTETDDGFFK